MSKLAIFGAGGAAREVAQWAIECGYKKITFTVDDDYFKESEVDGFSIVPMSQIDTSNFAWIVAVGNSSLREIVVKKVEGKAKFATLIHPTARVLASSEIAEGVIVAPGAGISINTKIGRHSIINAQGIIGHDCEIGEYATISPGVVVSGNCKIGRHVFLGANSSIREKTSISEETIVGMGAVVVNDLSKGTYVGSPARKIK